MPTLLCLALIPLQKDPSVLNDESSKGKFSYHTNRSSTWTLMHCFFFFFCFLIPVSGIFLTSHHESIQPLCTPCLDKSPTTSLHHYLLPGWHQTSALLPCCMKHNTAAALQHDLELTVIMTSLHLCAKAKYIAQPVQSTKPNVTLLLLLLQW